MNSPSKKKEFFHISAKGLIELGFMGRASALMGDLKIKGYEMVPASNRFAVWPKGVRNSS